MHNTSMYVLYIAKDIDSIEFNYRWNYHSQSDIVIILCDCAWENQPCWHKNKSMDVITTLVTFSHRQNSYRWPDMLFR